MALKKGSDDKHLEIPQISIGVTTVHLVGMTPLLTNRFGEGKIKQIEDKQQGAGKLVRPARNPKEEFEQAKYLLPDGRCGLPAAGVKKALVNGGGRFADETMTVLRGVVNVIPVAAGLIPIIAGEPTMVRHIGRLRDGTSSPIYRPQFDPWELSVECHFMTNMITLEQVLNLFQIAGFAVGLGDYRPENKGTYGTFFVKGLGK